MATQPLKPCRAVTSLYGGAQESDKQAVNTSETFIPGDLLVRVNNKLTKCGADPAIVTYIASCTETQQVPGETKVVVQRVKPSDTYVMSAFHSTASSATIADADLDGNSTYGIALQTVSGVAAWVMDLQDTTNIKVRLTGRIDAAADTYPQCLVQFLSTTLTFQA